MAYIPPHLRGKREADADAPQSKTGGLEESKVYALEDMISYYWPADCERHEPDASVHSKTLHDSAQSPGELVLVLLFHRANPQWQTEQTIYTKSSLELLPQVSVGREDMKNETIASTNEDTPPPADIKQLEVAGKSSPIAVFEQVRRGPSGTFKFDAYYNIAEVTSSEPHSKELITMLEKKWSRTDKRGIVINQV